MQTSRRTTGASSAATPDDSQLPSARLPWSVAPRPRSVSGLMRAGATRGDGDWKSGPVSFVHTVLVRFRMRLESSDDPKRIFRSPRRWRPRRGWWGQAGVALRTAVGRGRGDGRGDVGPFGSAGAARGRPDAGQDPQRSPARRGRLCGSGQAVSDWDDEAARIALGCGAEQARALAELGP